MKDFLKQLAERTNNPIQAGNLVREYLQARILEKLQASGVFINWVFHGGTALHFLYNLPRFSEDLDFSVVSLDEKDNFRDRLHPLKTAFEMENYLMRVTLNVSRTVKSAFLHFEGLPYELNQSPHRKQSLSIKIELDTHPPIGAGLMTSVVRRPILMQLHHHNQATLLAGKLHALLARRYIKGRDIYDLVWYLTDKAWPAPNLEYLQNALVQTKWSGPVVTMENWRDLVKVKLKSVNWRLIKGDVQPFLERPSEIQLLGPETILPLLG